MTPRCLVTLSVFLSLGSLAADLSLAADQKPVRKTTGIEKRVPWTTSRIQGTPEPPNPFDTEVAFKKLKFFEPLELVAVPGTHRLAVAERPGKIFTFVNDAGTSEPQLLVDVGRVVYSLEFHPRFKTNGKFYVTTEIKPETPESPIDIEVVQYQVKSHDPPVADPASRKAIIGWRCEAGHRGGCLRFGPDGMLYINVGDGSGIADTLNTGQDLSDLLASMLRIDVDHHDQGKAYRVPADNPFVKLAGARPEIWAYGLRQSWRMAFDRKGNLWAGEVGQDLWEMLNIIRRGGNYGWSVNEGTHPFRPERKLGPTPLVKPIVEHGHAEFRSITGGYFYSSSRLPELKDAYIYGDYDTGRIWMLRYQDGKVSDQRELVDTQLRVVAFGQDPAGEVYVVDFADGQLHRLVKAPPQPAQTHDFPRKLSETGLYSSTKDNRPVPGVIPYSVNAQLWSDGAIKERFLALPGETQIEFDTLVYPQGAPGAPPGWKFPHDTVLVKTFSLELEPGNPASRQRLETRILHFKKMPGTDEYGAEYWRGYTYIWNREQTDAELCGTDGENREYRIKDPKAEGGSRIQTWRFPSRAECTLCHTMAAKYALGVNTLQLNKDHDYGGVVANQLATLNHLGIFTKPLPTTPDKLPKLVDFQDTSADLNLRARSYLHANCSHCHRKWGGGNAEFQLLATQPLTDNGTLSMKVQHGTFGLADAKLIAPGSPERSLVHYRMQKTGLGRMPHIASLVVDEPAVKLIADWIKSLPETGAEKKVGIVNP